MRFVNLFYLNYNVYLQLQWKILKTIKYFHNARSNISCNRTCSLNIHYSTFAQSDAGEAGQDVQQGTGDI
jgi:hypothetical protein